MLLLLLGCLFLGWSFFFVGMGVGDVVEEEMGRVKMSWGVGDIVTN